MTADSQHPQTVSCKFGEPFPWPKRLRLQALEAVAIIVPGALVTSPKTIGEVIDAPGDAQIGFDPAPDGQGFETIRIKLRVNDAMEIKRSPQAIALAEKQGSVLFNVLSRP